MLVLLVAASSTFHLNKVTMSNDRQWLGFWELPKPNKGKEREWHIIARTTTTVPFGYIVDPDNDKKLLPVVPELEALELAKKHLMQYSYREVANWLNKQTNRSISAPGLRKRIQIEHRRKTAASIKRNIAKRLEAILCEIKALEEENIGAYTRKPSANG